MATIRKEKVVKKYQLVEFLPRDNENKSANKIRDIDIVCKHWIFFDDEENEILCQFMPPPYTNENIRLLADLLKTDAPAPEAWEAYPIVLRGHAATELRGQQNFSSSMRSSENINTFTKDDNALAISTGIGFNDVQIPKSFLHPGSSMNYNNDTISRKEFKQEVGKIHKGLSEIKADLREVVTCVRIISAKINAGGHDIAVMNNHAFINDHNLDVPFKELQEFLNFEASLKNDDDFKNKFIASLPQLFDPLLRVQKTITNVLRKYLSKTVALQYVAMKSTKDKLVFKDTSMHSCMIAAMATCHKDANNGLPLTEQSFLAELKNVLPNVKDWEGGRKSKTAVDDNVNNM